MKKSFLKQNTTFVTPLLVAKTEDELLVEIANCIEQGATAFGFMIERLQEDLRTEEKMTMFFEAMGDLPIYVTCYKNGDVVDETDDERAEYLLRALKCGATMADIRGDMFAPCEGELTVDKTAVEKQKKLIEKIHEMGKESLISSHVSINGKFVFLSTEEVLKMALEHQSRGADISKIVAGSHTDEELEENFKTFFCVKEKLDIELLFLCNGEKALPHRLAGPLMGEPFSFVKENKYVEGPYAAQQPISVIRALLDKVKNQA